MQVSPKTDAAIEEAINELSRKLGKLGLTAVVAVSVAVEHPDGTGSTKCAARLLYCLDDDDAKEKLCCVLGTLAEKVPDIADDINRIPGDSSVNATFAVCAEEDRSGMN